MIRLQAARGGEEARLFVEDLWKIYELHFRSAGVRSSVLARRSGGVVAELSAPAPLIRKLIEREAGEHIVQRKTRSRRRDQIHTSSVWVSIVEIDQRSEPELAEISRELEFETFRGHGAGGQHRNKRDTAVRARHPASGISCEILSGRSQSENKKRAALVVWERMRARDQSEREKRHAEAISSQREVIRTYDLVRGIVRDRRHGKAPWKRIREGRLELFD